MEQEQAFLLLQKLLSLAGQIKSSGHYSTGEIIGEIQDRLGEE